MENWTIDWIKIPGVISDRKQTLTCKAIATDIENAISFDCVLSVIKGNDFCKIKANKLYIDANLEKNEREIILQASYSTDADNGIYETINIILQLKLNIL